jgi:hypothetical protein
MSDRHAERIKADPLWLLHAYQAAAFKGENTYYNDVMNVHDPEITGLNAILPKNTETLDNQCFSSLLFEDLRPFLFSVYRLGKRQSEVFGRDFADIEGVEAKELPHQVGKRMVASTIQLIKDFALIDTMHRRVRPNGERLLPDATFAAQSAEFNRRLDAMGLNGVGALLDTRPELAEKLKADSDTILEVQRFQGKDVHGHAVLGGTPKRSVYLSGELAYLEKKKVTVSYYTQERYEQDVRDAYRTAMGKPYQQAYDTFSAQTHSLGYSHQLMKDDLNVPDSWVEERLNLDPKGHSQTEFNKALAVMLTRDGLAMSDPRYKGLNDALEQKFRAGARVAAAQGGRFGESRAGKPWAQRRITGADDDTPGRK